MKYTFILLLLLITGCVTETPTSLTAGDWRLTFQLDKDGGKVIPIQTSVAVNGNLTIHNASEKIEVDEIEIKGDSIYLRPPYFEGYFAGAFRSESVIQGNYINTSLDRLVPFQLRKGSSERFLSKNGNTSKTQELPSTWEVVFSPDSDQEHYIAKGNFEQNGASVSGTFETTTGDYRFLQGTYKNDSLLLSTFDGAHLFLFEAVVENGVMSGTFYSGNHWKEPFVGKANALFELPDANELTFLREGYDTVEFSFPNEKGALVSLSDDRFKNKVVILQVMGSWCPNCLDETKFYLDYLKNQNPTDVEFVGLAFEYAPTQEKAFESITRLRDKLGISYPILLAQYGTVDKNVANDKLPMLNQVLSYPTSIYISKDGTVRRIHTGYNGPATGATYDRFKEEFYSFMDELRVE